jgi:glycosyltransferase involved in cell wall biosynthesis
VNYQSWTGFDDIRFGYGSMLRGFIDSIPEGVKLDGKASVSVHMGTPNSCKSWLKGQHKVLFTMWETDELPLSFVRWLPLFDLILVPCQHNVDLFGQHHDKVLHVPLGVDTKFWSPQTGPDPGVFRFHGGGSLWRRKGLDTLVKAFNILGLPNTELHIKAAPHARDTPDTFLGDNIYLHREWMTLQEQRDWYNKAHVFVAPSRGEGFGLMPLQAISMGIPTIVSDSTGQAQFAHLATGVAKTRKVVSDSIGRWDETDPQHLANLMLDHYNNWKQYRQQALTTVPEVASFSWPEATRQLLDAIPTGTLLKTTKREEPFLAVKVEAIKKVDAQIGNNRYRMEKGEITTIPEGAYQVLHDSGVVRMVV